MNHVNKGPQMARAASGTNISFTAPRQSRLATCAGLTLSLCAAAT